MAVIRLGIHKNYVPDWGIWHAIRDLTQNALDEDDKGHTLTVKYWDKSSTLELLNTGSSLPEEALLIGFTTKADGKSRGQYGEGLKLAMLALVRAGCKVRVASCGRSYAPAIEPDPAMNGAETLVIRTSKCVDDGNTKVWVSGLSKADWETFRVRFTKWANYSDTIPTVYGTLIRDPEAKGKVYVKGIYACDVKDLSYGYDLKNCGLDRDRNVPRQFDLEYYTAQVLSSATENGQVAPSVLVSALKEGTPEGRQFQEWSFPKDKVAAEILAAHPDADAFAYSDAEAKDATSDMKVVVLPSRAKELLGTKLPTVAHVLQTRRMTPRALYSESDLTSVESANLDLFAIAVTGDEGGAIAADLDNVVGSVPMGKNKDGGEKFIPVVRRRNLRNVDGLAEALAAAPAHAEVTPTDILLALLTERRGLVDEVQSLRACAPVTDEIIRNASNQAEDVLQQARRKAREIEDQAAKEAGERGRKWIESCRADAEKERDAILAKANADADALRDRLVEQIVAAVADRVVTANDIQGMIQELL